MWFKRKLYQISKDNEYIPDVVKPKPTYNNYISENGNSLSSVNQLHQSLSEMIYRTHGVSLRHLQGYLNWMVFKRHMSFKVDKAFWKSEAYRKVLKGKSTIGALTIHHKPFPISFEYDTDDTIYIIWLNYKFLENSAKTSNFVCLHFLPLWRF